MKLGAEFGTEFGAEFGAEFGVEFVAEFGAELAAELVAEFEMSRIRNDSFILYGRTRRAYVPDEGTYHTNVPTIRIFDTAWARPHTPLPSC